MIKRIYFLAIAALICSMPVQAQNLLDLSNWTIGNGSTGEFAKNGSDSENIREWGTGPRGKKIIVWKAVPDAVSNSDGGWNSSYYSIDHSKMYRLSVWIKKTNSNNGTTHFGPRAQGGDLARVATGSTTSNPYFFSSDLPGLDQWYLLVSYVHGSGDNSTTELGKIYNGATGEVVQSIKDYKFNTTTTALGHRAYLYYDTNTADRQYFYAPRIDEVNGDEPSITELLGISSVTTDEVKFGGKLTVDTEINAQITLKSGPDHYSHLSFAEKQSDGSVDYHGGLSWWHNEDYLTLSTYGSDKPLVLNNFSGSNVGIGTTNPTEKLSVDGTVLAKEVKVSTQASDWPDYVFDAEYQLKTLKQVEAFIEANGHLPNMPKADDIVANGQKLGLIQQRMLEKIEELTLYVIELKKEINQLKTNKQ